MSQVLRLFFLSSLLIFVCLAVSRPVKAYPRKTLGLGLILGEPFALSGKYWMDRTNAWDFALGSWSYYSNGIYSGLNAHVDYLWHRYGVFGSMRTDAGKKLPLYFGVGGVFLSPGAAGVRGIGGITYIFDHPFDVFFELAPTLLVVPGAYFGVEAGLGGRFYF